MAQQHHMLVVVVVEVVVVVGAAVVVGAVAAGAVVEVDPTEPSPLDATSLESEPDAQPSAGPPSATTSRLPSGDQASSAAPLPDHCARSPPDGAGPAGRTSTLRPRPSGRIVSMIPGLGQFLSMKHEVTYAIRFPSRDHAGA